MTIEDVDKILNLQNFIQTVNELGLLTRLIIAAHFPAQLIKKLVKQVVSDSVVC